MWLLNGIYTKIVVYIVLLNMNKKQIVKTLELSFKKSNATCP